MSVIYKLLSLLLLTAITTSSINDENSLVLVSTLDGSVSALDNYGNIKWSLSTTPGAMFTSSLSQMQITRNGRLIRLVPGLDGGLFQFDGEEVTALPLTTDILLSSSFSLGEGLVVTGGKERKSYAVNLTNGKVYYECGMTGCSYYGKESCSGDEMMLIQRDTQVVRVIDSKTGHETWNYSVSQHGIQVIPKAEKSGCVGKIPTYLDQPNSVTEVPPSLASSIKVAVPHGTVMALNGDNTVLWQYKFEAPVVNAWILSGEEIFPLNLFNSENIPSANNVQPALYIGVFKDQLYVQQSNTFQSQVKHVSRKYPFISSKEYPKVMWRPYLFTSASRTPAIHGSQAPKMFLELMPPEAYDTLSTALVLKDDSGEYPFDNGFYLFSDQDTSKLEEDQIKEPDIFLPPEEDITDQLIGLTSSLMDYWKEVLVISITTAVLSNLLFYRMIALKPKEAPEIIIVEKATPVTIEKEISLEETIVENNVSETPKDLEFASRFLNDFTPLQFLGKGGFGVVFEAKNKIDDCHYAIKRICLPKKDKARERVMREVKALAKLDHVGIVRYYNSWMEEPPKGWEVFEGQWKGDGTTDGLTETTNQETMPSLTKDQTEPSLRFKNVTEDDSIIIEFKDESVNNNVFNSDKSDASVIFENSKLHKSSTKTESKVTESVWITKSESTNTNLYLYIQMQLCLKESLKDWLRDNTSRDKTMILDFYQQIVSAVHYVHEQGLMHRDLKPSNIFFSAVNGVIKIGDFGLVTDSMELPSDTEIQENNRKTRRHTQEVGTRLYMSPEQINKKSYDNKIDIYSLGIIFFELLVPFYTESERTKVLLGVRECNLPNDFVKQYVKESELLTKLLAADPTDRPGTEEILGDQILEEINAELPFRRRSHTRSRSFSTVSSGSTTSGTTVTTP